MFQEEILVNWLFFKKGFIMGKLARIFSSRAGLYRFLFVCASIHIICTFSGSLMPRQLLMSISDYYQNLGIKEDELFKIYGVLKMRSLQLKKGSLESKFIMTDFKNELEVLYNGLNKFEFKEGETLIITAYVPDMKYKNRIVCIDYMSKHSMETENWEGPSNQGRGKFGMMMERDAGKMDPKYSRIG